jgi:hypothetical protein
MAPLHEGSSAGKSDLCCGRSLDVVGRPGLHQSSPMSICFAGCSSPGLRKNDLTIYWALGPFVRSFTLLVDPGDICPPHFPSLKQSLGPSELFFSITWNTKFPQGPPQDWCLLPQLQVSLIAMKNQRKKKAIQAQELERTQANLSH